MDEAVIIPETAEEEELRKGPWVWVWHRGCEMIWKMTRRLLGQVKGGAF